MGPIRRTINILEGWLKSYGLLKATTEDRQIAKNRLSICVICEEAKESKTLKLLRGKATYEKQIKCSLCSCPCNEKVLVMSENCPKNKW